MSAADDSRAAGRRLTGWFDRRGQIDDIPVADDDASPHGTMAIVNAVVSGLPDPVILIDRDGRVITFNVPAVALAPTLRRGDPVSIALRVPDLVEAVREANVAGRTRRIEFSERSGRCAARVTRSTIAMAEAPKAYRNGGRRSLRRSVAG
jgi:two-component system phosphate regulon sensor histidine kinase PhoR